MTLPVKDFIDSERYLCDLARKELSDSWLLTRSVWPSIFFLTTYLLFVLKIGPAFMTNRREYELKPIVLVFNLLQFSTNAYMWIRFVSMDGGITYLLENSCHESNRVDSKFCREASFLTWLYYVLKVGDLFDTVFFVLKKKQSHVSFLHIYHHVCMVLASWYFGRNTAGSQIIIIGGLNNVVHTIMYAYYFLSALGPKVQKYLWWKIYVTQLQMIQFILIITYMIYLIVNQCSFPKSECYIVIIRELSLTILFFNFYIRSYRSTVTKPANGPLSNSFPNEKLKN